MIVDHHEGMYENLLVMKEMAHVKIAYSETDPGASLAWIIVEEDQYSRQWTKERLDRCPLVVRIVRARDLWVFDQERDELNDVKSLAEALYGSTDTTPQAFRRVFEMNQSASLSELQSKASVSRRILSLFCSNLERKVQGLYPL